MSLTVSVIGAGAIGAPVIEFVDNNAAFALGQVLTRSGGSGTADAEAFFAVAADIIIDAAGPDVLRAHGSEALARADLWTVGGGALADDDLRIKMERIARQTGHRLRLFSHWVAGADHAGPGSGARMHVRQSRPGPHWTGSLREAAVVHADTVNSAVSAALTGPGLDAVSFELVDSGENGGHRFEAVIDTSFGQFATDIDFGDPRQTMPHPTAAALIAALRREVSPIQYG